MRRATVLLTIAAIAFTGCGGGGSKAKTPAIADPLGEALAYLPRDAPVLAAIATDVEHGQGAAARNLVERFPGAELAVANVRERIDAITGLPATGDVAPLLGNDLTAAQTSSGPFVAWVVKDAQTLRTLLDDEVAQNILDTGAESEGFATYTRTGTLIAVKGAVVVAGAPMPVREALARRARSAGMTRALFTARLRGLPADALVRAEGNPRLLESVGLPSPAYLGALSRFALTVRADANGLHARMRAAASPDDLPIPIGAQAPMPLGRTNGATVGVRDLRHVIRFALRRLQATKPSAYRRLDLAKKALKLLRGTDVDRDVIDQLGGTATVWSPDLSMVTLSARVADPGRLANALKNLRPLMGRILGAAGVKGANVGADRAADTYRVTRGSALVARYGMVGATLVVTTNRLAPLARLVAGGPGRINALPGALAGVVRGPVLRTELIKRFGLPSIASLALGALGDATFAVHAEPGGIEAAADLAIG